MDLLEKISKEIEIRQLDDFEKLRYIYLECCKIFSFDTRYYYMQMNSDVEKEILNKKFDLSNINDNLVICHTFANEILGKLIREFTDLEFEIRSGIHSYILVQFYDNTWKLDATLSDLSRVKMNLYTTGFYPLRSDFKDYIDAIDEACGYNVTRYTETLEMNLSDKLKWIQSNLKNSSCKNSYADALYYLKYFTANDRFTNNTFFDFDFNFHRLIETLECDVFYDLHKTKDEFLLEKIDETRYEDLKKVLIYKKKYEI